MPRSEILDRIPVPERLFLFRSCVSSNKYPGLEAATVEVMKILGVELVESDDQTCCGGFLTFTNVAEVTATMPAVARNLSLAEERGLDTLAVCNGCHTFLTEFGHFLNERPAVMETVNMMLRMTGHEYRGTTHVWHVAEMLYRLKDRIAANVKRPLGLRVATHYGCHYLNGFKATAIDDYNEPTFMQDLIEIMGGTPVYYEEQRTCCGTGLTQIITHKEELALPHTKRKLDSLNAARPDVVAVICPYCLSQLDRMQHKLRERGVGRYSVPVISLSQLVGLALDIPERLLGLEAHAIPAVHLAKAAGQGREA